MRTIATYKAVLRATSATLCLALVRRAAAAQLRPGAAARAQELNAPAQQCRGRRGGQSSRTPPRPAAAPAHHPAHHGERHPARRAGHRAHLCEYPRRRRLRSAPMWIRRLKALFGTGLFSDVKINFNRTARWRSGWSRIPSSTRWCSRATTRSRPRTYQGSADQAARDLHPRPRQADVQRIIELYRRNGKFAARVDPQIIQRPQNRVDLIFSITEGPTTGIARINFIGNKVYDASTLKGQIATEESAWYKFLASNDNYDPDRLAFDREQLAPLLRQSRLCRFHGGERGGPAGPESQEISTSPSPSMKARAIASARSRSIPRSRN